MELTVEYIQQGSAKWSSEDEQSAIDCVVKFHQIDEELEFRAEHRDPATHMQQVWQMLMNGDAGVIGSFADWDAERQTREAAVRTEHQQMFPNDG